MKTIQILFLGVTLLFCSSHLNAQEMQAKKYDNLDWVRMAFVKFQPGKMDQAMGIIKDYFQKADENMGGQGPTAYVMATGEYDMVVVWEMEEGIESMDYEITDHDVKWIAQMEKLTGGQEKAMEKLNEFYSYIADWRTEIARKQ